ncbi:MAG: hypothetical protein D6806_01280, partial [Deltaproteobacteria bacterium]
MKARFLCVSLFAFAIAGCSGNDSTIPCTETDGGNGCPAGFKCVDGECECNIDCLPNTHCEYDTELQMAVCVPNEKPDGGIADTDSDGVPDDGDSSGSSRDNPCTGGNTTGCDDNCQAVPNPDQADRDGDGKG